MPLFSEHIANMYYGSSSPYTGSSYGYSSSVSPLGTSYSAPYLNPGGSYSNHSSIGSYSRAPVTSRWITSSGRNYSPMLSTISERGSASPVRINSPRRLPLSTRTYGTPSYTPRPVNINTADIDVSRNRYRQKIEVPTPQPQPPPPPPERESSSEESENGPFMPRVDGKPETGIDSSPGVERSTIKRGRTVVRLYTIKRKERDSPRKPTEGQQNSGDLETADNLDVKTDEKEFMKWREKLSDDLAYKGKKEKKSLGAKLVEKFILKDDNDKDSEIPTKLQKREIENTEAPVPMPEFSGSKCQSRRCSMDLMAEQANVFDSLIRSENLSTATLDLSKVGIVEDKNNLESSESLNRQKSDNLHNPLKTTKSDYSLHDSLKSYKDVRDPRNFNKRRSIKKSSSGSSIRRLDSITEFDKEPINVNLPAIEECKPTKPENTKQKPKTKLKTKITASVEVTEPKSPLKFVVENVTVEEKVHVPRKGITYSSEVEELPANISMPLEQIPKVQSTGETIKNIVGGKNEPPSPEPEGGDFWDKIGKRETVYLMKRKQNIDAAKEKHKRALFWFPEEEESASSKEDKPNDITESSDITNNSDNIDVHIADNICTNILIMPFSNKSEEDNQSIKTTFIDIETSKHQIDENQDVENVDSKKDLNEIKIENSLNTECSHKAISAPIRDMVQDRDSKSMSEIACVISENSSKPKTTVLSQEYKNIGKSASLETINDSKAKVPSEKKTKSEKSKKSLKTETKFERKPLQPLLPKPNVKVKALATLSVQQTPDNINKKCVLSKDMAVVMEKSQNNVNDKEETKVPCPIHPFGLQKAKEITSESISAVINNSSTKVVANSKVAEKMTNDSDTPKVSCPLALEGSKKEKEILPLDADKDLSEAKLLNKPTSSVDVNTDNYNKINTTVSLTSETPAAIISKICDTTETVSNTSNLNLKDAIHSPKVSSSNIKLIENSSELPKIDKTENEMLGSSSIMPKIKEITTNKINNSKSLNKNEDTVTDSKIPNLKKNFKIPQNIGPEVKPKDNNAIKKPCYSNKNNKIDEKVLATSNNSVEIEVPSTSSANNTTIPVTTLSKTDDSDSYSVNARLHTETEILNIPVKQVTVEPQDIPNRESELKAEIELQCEEKTGEENKAESITLRSEQEKSESEVVSPPALLPSRRPVKEEKAVKPLIATPRPLQKKSPQVIHSSDSSDTSSEEESSEDEDTDSSEGSGEFFECENNPDGRTSTGSNDSGFDSSAPASPATFSQIKKDCDVNCHRKCEKLTANLCGVNQRLLVEALASRTASKKGGEASAATSSSSAPAQLNNTDIVEQELEQSTAYDIFKKTGRFTPPARSIPRFRKYTVEDFQFIKVLGKGSFGKVLLAELRDTEYYYAVKCLKKDVVLEDDDVECTLIERKVLALGTNHPYLCHLFATFQTDSHLFFVMEYLNGGDLMFHIQQSGRFPEARGRFYAAEIVSGLKFLHKRGIVYRDLKLDNILLDFEGHVRIADFGMCKLQIYLDKTADTFCGTPDYMAPEIIKGLKYNQTVDWWSFGVLLYEMLIGQSPFSGCDEDELFWSICNEMPSYPRFLSHEALTILTRLLDKDARTRLGGTECMHGDIRDQEFFHPIHWDRLERRELESPFRPRVRHPMDTQYFDRAFTGERPRLTAVEPHVLRSMDQEPFRGFSYTNPNTTDR